MGIVIVIIMAFISYEVYSARKKQQQLDDTDDEPLDLMMAPSEEPSWGTNNPPVVSVS